MSFAQRLQQRKQGGLPGLPQKKQVAQPESRAITGLAHLDYLAYQQNNKSEEKPANAVQDDRVIHPGVQQWEALYGQPEAPAPPPVASTPPPDSQAEVSPVLSVVARAHSRPEWVQARDDWHRHYFACEVCQRHHKQQTKRPFQPNPCEEGQALHANYENLC